MKWHKFVEMTTRHPELYAVVQEMGCPLAEVPETVLKAFVTEKVTFIAYRPLSSLNRQSTNTIEWEPVHFYRRSVMQQVWNATSYWIYFWVPGEKTLRAHSLFKDEKEDPDPTLVDALASVSAWYERWWAQQGPIRWAFILKMNHRGGVSGMTQASFEIYPFD